MEGSSFFDEKVRVVTTPAGEEVPAFAVINPDGSIAGSVPAYAMRGYYATSGLDSIQYICEAQTGTAVGASLWRIRKVTTVTAAGELTSIEWANGLATFTNPATDLATVQALSYS